MNLTVTITGADEGVDQYELIHLSRFYPFVEWGILFSAKRRGHEPRYPSFAWIRDLENLTGSLGSAGGLRARLSMHLCGSEARTAAAMAESFEPGECWERIQVNGYQPNAATEKWRRIKSHRIALWRVGRWILQARSIETLEAVFNDALTADADVLFDPSGGAGAKPLEWPKMPVKILPYTARRCGFAGGITPENVRDVIGAVAAKNETLESIWIDMESGVRTDDKFDLDKVESVLDSVAMMRASLK